MKDPIKFYKAQLKKHQEDVKATKKKLIKLSLYRFLSFIIPVFGIYLTYQQKNVAIIIGILGLVTFLFLLKSYAKTKIKKQLSETLVKINKEEIEIQLGDFFDRPQGWEFQNPNHFYSLDIDLFGRGSFFQYINRATINEGAKVLANELLANNPNKIVSRQEAIKELANITKWRQQFSATASLIKIDTPAETIINWLKNYTAFLPKMMRFLPQVFTAISALFFILTVTNIFTTIYPIAFWLLFGLAITGKYVKKTSKLSSNSDKVKYTFRQYSLLLNLIEEKEFTSKILINQQLKITSKDKKSSQIFNEFSKLLDALDSRNNMLFALIGDGFLLWDIKQSYKIEQWIHRYSDTIEDWFNVISFFEAYNSLGNFSFNHPTYIYPKIVASKTALKTESLGHPLLNKEKRIDNSIEINHQQFFIITGANMAGKSTFLRTVSLHIVMANMGLPICATKSEYSPVKLITSMRTSDSLTDDSSYFFSELTRLKFIVDQIQKEPYFIILDEILKGTNSTDKAIGSRKFVEKLVTSNATGIIATHDLSLCEVAKEIEVVKNYYFDAEIINDELYFDYSFKKGICKNMNASFLLRKMEII
ncbi:MAG: DNA mismatch repair protein MutS [Flavobacteriaceae bacterium]|nr:MAG: DNA mismatch repair protein MutS [Flavobacteriaceae bacterium]